MARREFPVLVATDGSAGGRAAVAMTIHFPWPAHSRAHGLVARRVPIGVDWSPEVWDALARAEDVEARHAARRLRARWPNADVAVVSAPPVEAILRAIRKLRVAAVVLGSRGHGALGRLVLGSVSRAVVRRAACPVLVVRGRSGPVRRLLVGVDGSAHARRAVELVAALSPPPDGEVRLLSVVEPVRVASSALLPASIRASVGAEAAALEQERVTTAERQLAGARALVARRGWHVHTEVATGSPLDALLAAAAATDVVVVGARGVGGVTRLLLGSVAEGALSRAPVPVLVVR